MVCIACFICCTKVTVFCRRLPDPPGPLDVNPQGAYPSPGACYGHKAVLQSEIIIIREGSGGSPVDSFGKPCMRAIDSSPRRRYRPVSRGPPSGASHTLAALTKPRPSCIGQQTPGFGVPLILNRRMYVTGHCALGQALIQMSSTCSQGGWEPTPSTGRTLSTCPTRTAWWDAR